MAPAQIPVFLSQKPSTLSVGRPAAHARLPQLCQLQVEAGLHYGAHAEDALPPHRRLALLHLDYHHAMVAAQQHAYRPNHEQLAT